MDTIFAQATAAGRAGVAVVRISGPKAHATGQTLVGVLPKSHVGALRTLRSKTGDKIDQIFLIKFDAPHSFTGEDVVELHLHGSLAVIEACLKELSEFAELRLAEPGEFTRRALENDRLDLAQVEGLADLIDAETEAQRKQALRVFSGELGSLVEKWRVDLVRAAALLEATIDFADEDVPVDVTPEVKTLIKRVTMDLEREIDGSIISERIREGFEVAILGPPNAGKSSLLNALAGRDAAITSEVAGTTRDIIEVRMNLGGLPVTLLDTAGIRETSDEVESIGIARALERAERADLRVVLQPDGQKTSVCLLPDDIVVRPKTDVVGGEGISSVSGDGIEELIFEIQSVLSRRGSGAGVATQERHRVAMTGALKSLFQAVEVLESGPDLYDIATEELRSAIRRLETLVGRIDVENLLDEIFSSFCLGK